MTIIFIPTKRLTNKNSKFDKYRLILNKKSLNDKINEPGDERSNSGKVTPMAVCKSFIMLNLLKGGVKSISTAFPLSLSVASGWYVTLYPPVICFTMPEKQ